MSPLEIGIIAAAVAVIGSMCGAGVWIVNMMIENRMSRLESTITSKLDELKQYSINHTNAQLGRIEAAIGEVKDVLSEHDEDLAKTMADLAVMGQRQSNFEERLKALEQKRGRQ